MTRHEITEAIAEAMEDLNPAAASVEIDLKDLDISPHDRLVNYDSLTHKLKAFAAQLERLRRHVV